MFAAVGNHVVALHREAIGGLTLPSDLAAGEFRLLTPADAGSAFRSGPVGRFSALKNGNPALTIREASWLNLRSFYGSATILRLADNPALDAALASGRKILCVYIHDEKGEGLRPAGGASRWRLRSRLAGSVRIAGPAWRRRVFLARRRGRVAAPPCRGQRRRKKSLEPALWRRRNRAGRAAQGAFAQPGTRGRKIQRLAAGGALGGGDQNRRGPSRFSRPSGALCAKTCISPRPCPRRDKSISPVWPEDGPPRGKIWTICLWPPKNPIGRAIFPIPPLARLAPVRGWSAFLPRNWTPTPCSATKST